MSDYELERDGRPGLSISMTVVAAVIVIGFGMGLLAGWLSSSSGPTNAARQQAAATILPDAPPLITNMPPLSEAGEPPIGDIDINDESDEAPPVTAPLQPPPPPPAMAQPETAEHIMIAPALKMPAPVATPAARAPHPAKPAAPTRAGRWIVQLGAFGVEDHAKLLLVGLTAHGYAAEITAGRNAAGAPFFFVRSGHFPSRAAATDAAREIAERTKFPTYVMELPGAAR
jgi:cell division septation protein DedD